MKNDIEKLRKQAHDTISATKQTNKYFYEIAAESGRVADVARDASAIIERIDCQFKQATKLNELDMSFLFVAVAAQCIRQYLIAALTERVDDQTAAIQVKGDHSEHSSRSHRLYCPTLEEIIENPVPFDTNFGGGKNGFDLKIGGGFNHRARTLGHDPLLGWVFGTMNIATSTLTTSEGVKSFHVLTGHTARGDARDLIAKRASTKKVFEYSQQKLLSEGLTGKEIIAVSLMKEAIHLRSDLYSKTSLPLPVVSVISVPAANKLADFGLDMGNVIQWSGQAMFAVFINCLIAMVHGLFFDPATDGSMTMYSIRTRKILSYSNVIAAGSNVLNVAMTGNVHKLDVGGIIVALHRLVSDIQFIYQIKKEFLAKEFYNVVMGDDYDFL